MARTAKQSGGESRAWLAWGRWRHGESRLCLMSKEMLIQAYGLTIQTLLTTEYAVRAQV